MVKAVKKVKQNLKNWIEFSMVMIPKAYLTKLEQLKRLYNLYDGIVCRTTTACMKGCATCCTCNVTLTSLESLYFFSVLGTEDTAAVLTGIRTKSPEPRYHPRVTINGFAGLCIKGEAAPLEENDPGWGACPLLSNAVCTVYEARPFGCRSLVSDTICREFGHAAVSEFILTCNTVFMQYIEHLDGLGLSGNLADMLFYYGTGRHFNRNRLIPNQEAKILLVPQEHRRGMEPIIREISRILQ